MSVDTKKLGVTVAHFMELVEENWHEVDEDDSDAEVVDAAIIVKLKDEEGNITYAFEFTDKDLDNRIGLLERIKHILLL